MKVKATGVELTSETRKRIEWICEKLEKMARGRDLKALQCDIAVSKIHGGNKDDLFRVEIYLSGFGESLAATAAAGSAIAALDAAHDEIERAFFRFRRSERDTQKIRDFGARQALERRKSEEARKAAREKEPPRGNMQTRVDE